MRARRTQNPVGDAQATEVARTPGSSDVIPEGEHADSPREDWRGSCNERGHAPTYRRSRITLRCLRGLIREMVGWGLMALPDRPEDDGKTTHEEK